MESMNTPIHSLVCKGIITIPGMVVAAEMLKEWGKRRCQVNVFDEGRVWGDGTSGSGDWLSMLSG